MMLEVIVGFGAVGLALVGAWTVWSVVAATRLEGEARSDLAVATELGMLPPSLYPRVDLDRCIGSGACVTVCPEKDVLGVIDGKAHVVNPTSCIGHGECL